MGLLGPWVRRKSQVTPVRTIKTYYHPRVPTGHPIQLFHRVKSAKISKK